MKKLLEKIGINAKIAFRKKISKRNPQEIVMPIDLIKGAKTGSE